MEAKLKTPRMMMLAWAFTFGTGLAVLGLILDSFIDFPPFGWEDIGLAAGFGYFFGQLDGRSAYESRGRPKEFSS